MSSKDNSYFQELKSMRWGAACLIVASIAAVCVATSWWFCNYFVVMPAVSDFQTVQQHVNRHAEQLELVAKSNDQKGRPSANSTTKFSVSGTDAHGNVYFVVDWNVFATSGFVYRVDGAELLGTESLTNLRNIRHIRDRWWYFVCD